MKSYPINEIFYSLQGEGLYSGCPTIFIRFSGCNLHCPFCDTDHSASRHMGIQEIMEEVRAYSCRRVTLTGGEPSLFADKSLLDVLHENGYTIAIETNGTGHVTHEDYDWITLSPKNEFQSSGYPVLPLRTEICDELKVVFTGSPLPDSYLRIPCRYRYLQPCDMGDPVRNKKIMQSAIEYCMANSEWSLSLQIHKLLHIR